MLHRRSILNAVLVAVIIMAAGAAFLVWRHQQRAAIVLRGLPKIPDLSRWPEALSRQVFETTALAKGAGDPVEPLGRLMSSFFANGYYVQATQALAALRELEPGNARWAYILAETNLRMADTNGAENAAAIAARLAPSYLPAWFRLGSLRLQRGAMAEARECYARAAAEAPKDVTASYLLIRFDSKLGTGGDLRGALAELAQAHPEIKNLHGLLAELDAAAGDLAGSANERRLEARAKFVLPSGDQWIEDLAQFSFNPDNPRGLARAAAAEGRFETADKLMKHALDLPKVDTELLGEFSQIYVFMGRTNDGLHVLEQGVLRCPEDPGLHAQWSQMLVSMGRNDEAVEVLRKALQRWPNDAGLHNAMGCKLRDAGKPELAVAELREAVRLDSNLPETYWNLSVCLFTLGKRAEGRAAVQTALVIRPDYVDAMLLLGQTSLEDGDLVTAEPAIKRVIELSPDDPKAQTLFWVLQSKKGAEAERAGKPAEAEEFYNAGLEVVPGCAPLLRAKGALKYGQDRFEEAVDAFRSYVSLEPTKLDGYLLLGQALQKAGHDTEARQILEVALGMAEKRGNPDAIQGCKRLLGR